ncbi:MAG: hypothetical protein R3C16_12800 [Hyphomonadaceae bacterium]
MRLLFLAAALTVVSVAEAAEPPGARAAYVERRGLLEADSRCRGLLSRDLRQALQAGAAQARGALLRAGWNNAQVSELEGAVVNAARARACNDPRNAQAVEDAEVAFARWTSASTMEFPGWSQNWLARRAPDRDGWRLRQTLDGGAVFGVRDQTGRQHLSLIIPLASGQAAPSTARIVMRDPARAPMREVALPQRVAFGLEAGAPPPGVATLTVSATRNTNAGQRNQAVFDFADVAFQRLMQLDPRETIELRVETGRVSRRYLVEVGDVAVARTYLALAD